MGTIKRSPAIREAFSFAGGVAGLMVFLFGMLQASLVYGGAAGVAILHGLGLHDPDESFLQRLIIWFGMLLGALATAAIMIVVGAVIGAALYGLFGPKKGGATPTTEEKAS